MREAKARNVVVELSMSHLCKNNTKPKDKKSSQRTSPESVKEEKKTNMTSLLPAKSLSLFDNL
jgi:hypothetical protein